MLISGYKLFQVDKNSQSKLSDNQQEIQQTFGTARNGTQATTLVEASALTTSPLTLYLLVTFRSCSIRINRFNRKPFAFTQLTFLNRTLFQPFSVETRKSWD